MNNETQLNHLVLSPFREVVVKCREAVENAKTAQNDAGVQAMTKASRGLLTKSERALGKIEPLCKRLLEEYGEVFIDALKESEEIRSHRERLNELLWDFDDHLTIETFEEEVYTNISKAVRSAVLSICDVLVRMKLERPSPSPEHHLPKTEPERETEEEAERAEAVRRELIRLKMMRRDQAPRQKGMVFMGAEPDPISDWEFAVPPLRRPQPLFSDEKEVVFAAPATDYTFLPIRAEIPAADPWAMPTPWNGTEHYTNEDPPLQKVQPQDETPDLVSPLSPTEETNLGFYRRSTGRLDAEIRRALREEVEGDSPTISLAQPDSPTISDHTSPTTATANDQPNNHLWDQYEQKPVIKPLPPKKKHFTLRKSSTKTTSHLVALSLQGSLMTTPTTSGHPSRSRSTSFNSQASATPAPVLTDASSSAFNTPAAPAQDFDRTGSMTSVSGTGNENNKNNFWGRIKTKTDAASKEERGGGGRWSLRASYY